LTIKAVLFDFADTLVHTNRFDYDTCLGKVVQSLCDNGVAVPFASFRRGYLDSRDRFYRQTEKTLEEQDFAERMSEALEFCGIKLDVDDERIREATEAFSNCFIKSLTVDDYLPSLLKKLHEEYRLAVVSNMSFAKAIFEGIRKFDIAKHFDEVVVSGVLGWRKPSPRIFKEALQALDVKAEEAVFVGDSPKADVEGAKQLNMKTVLLMEKTKKQPVTDTAQFYMGESKSSVKPDRIIRKLADLPRALHSLSEHRESAN
jgi:putative hydrolase of the HAD superfamily